MGVTRCNLKTNREWLRVLPLNPMECGILDPSDA